MHSRASRCSRGSLLRGTGSRRAAFAAGALLLASTQFLLYGREARSYAPNLLLTLLVLAGFLRLGERRRDPWLALAAVLLFHVQILPAALALAACALASLHPAPPRRFVPLLARAPWVMAATVPWLALSWSAAGTNWTPLESPAALLVTEAPRGGLGHWVHIRDGKIENYQAVVPTTWNGSPRDALGQRGIFEQALLGIPVSDPTKPVEVLRAIHSFDPCMACAVHIVDTNHSELTQVLVESF